MPTQAWACHETLERRLQNPVTAMICLICKQGAAEPGCATVTLQRDDCMAIVKGVPADLCEDCGESYVSEKVTRELLRRAEVPARNGMGVEILANAE